MKREKMVPSAFSSKLKFHSVIHAATVFTTAEPTIPRCAYNQLTSLFQVAGAEKTRQRPPLINFTNMSFKKHEWKRVKFVIS